MGLFSGLGNAIAGVMGMVGIGPDSAAAQAANVGAQNQLNAEVTAQEERIRSATNLMEQEQANRQVEGSQRAAIGGSGVSMNTGSPLDAEASTFISDQFKDQVAVFNGQVNLAQDQAQAASAALAASATEKGANASAAATDFSLLAMLFKK